MSEPIIYIDTSSIHKDKLDELKDAIEYLTGFVEENMPRLIYYGFFFNRDRSKMSVVAIHPDSKSIETHMDRGKEEFQKFSEFLDLLRIDIYGEVSKPVIERLNNKAQMLGDATVSIHDYKAGFIREIEEWTG
jgi:hypothetical protein